MAKGLPKCPNCRGKFTAIFTNHEHNYILEVLPLTRIFVEWKEKCNSYMKCKYPDVKAKAYECILCEEKPEKHIKHVHV